MISTTTDIIFASIQFPLEASVLHNRVCKTSVHLNDMKKRPKCSVWGTAPQEGRGDISSASSAYGIRSTKQVLFRAFNSKFSVSSSLPNSDREENRDSGGGSRQFQIVMSSTRLAHRWSNLRDSDNVTDFSSFDSVFVFTCFFRLCLREPA